ncbi:hypothetical protein G7054_g1120 [Neopestalotiopsis clavispora]|nr:hypothetical protein G7054_g1120 [Neopestalotiopsis clavispora]
MASQVDFQAMPKIELHAHLSGSVSRQCLHEIWLKKKEVGATDLEDPLVVMPVGKHDYDLNTFFPLFSSYIYQLINDRESLEYSTKAVVGEFAADGVVYLELRTTPRAMPGADVNTQGGVYGNALQAASAKGHQDIVQMLLANGADVNTQGGVYGNALQAASRGGHREIVQLLVNIGVNVNASHTASTPLLVAAKRGHIEVVCLLLAAGADYRVADNFARTTLTYATIWNHSKVVDILFSEPGVDFNAKDYWGATAVSFAARFGRSEIFGKIATVPSIDLHAEDAFGRTSLWWAQKQRHAGIATALVKRHQPTNDEQRKSHMLAALGEPTAFPNEFPGGKAFCDVCMASLDTSWYGCADCDSGAYAMCLECHGLGARCLGESHTLSFKSA